MTTQHRPDRPLPVVILVQDLEFGGTQRYVSTLLQHLDRSIVAPEVWVLRRGDDMLPQVRAAGVEPKYLSRDSWVTPRSLFNLGRELWIRKPRVLYTLTAVPNIWGRLFGWGLRVPVIVSGYRNLIPQQQEQWLWRLSRRIICNARALKEMMIERFRVDPARVAVIHNSVDPEHFRPQEAEKAPVPTVLYAGRLVDEKDPQNVLTAFRYMTRDLPRARMIMAGNGPLQDRLLEDISRHHLEDRVELVPAVEDIRPLLEQAWLLILGSKREGCPNIILEAMAAGLPVAASNVGGIPELVDDGKTGLLAPPENPQEMAWAMYRILSADSLRLDMARRARDKVLGEFTPGVMARRTEEVFLEAARDAGLKVD